MLWGIYSAIYDEVNVSVEKSVEIKGDYVEKLQSCFISVILKRWSGQKLLDPTTYVVTSLKKYVSLVGSLKIICFSFVSPCDLSCSSMILLLAVKAKKKKIEVPFITWPKTTDVKFTHKYVSISSSQQLLDLASLFHFLQWIVPTLYLHFQNMCHVCNVITSHNINQFKPNKPCKTILFKV